MLVLFFWHFMAFLNRCFVCLQCVNKMSAMCMMHESVIGCKPNSCCDLDEHLMARLNPCVICCGLPQRQTIVDSITRCQKCNFNTTAMITPSHTLWWQTNVDNLNISFFLFLCHMSVINSNKKLNKTAQISMKCISHSFLTILIFNNSRSCFFLVFIVVYAWFICAKHLITSLLGENAQFEM